MKKSKEHVIRSNDEIREVILAFLYEKHKSARSLKSVALKISEIKNGLKKFDLVQTEIISNLDYLIQKGWIMIDVKEFTFKSKRGFDMKNETKAYKISDTGIDHIEGESRYKKAGANWGINVTNINGVTILGNENIVNTQYSDLYRELLNFSELLKKSVKIDDETKLNIISDVETIKSQLSKPSPDRGIIKKVWESIQNIVTINDLIDLTSKIIPLIQRLIS